jgi:hypothetical protein
MFRIFPSDCLFLSANRAVIGITLRKSYVPGFSAASVSGGEQNTSNHVSL